MDKIGFRRWLKSLKYVLGIIFFIISIIIGGIYIMKYINYKLFYREMVKQEIKNMVKPEALQNGN